MLNSGEQRNKGHIEFRRRLKSYSPFATRVLPIALFIPNYWAMVLWPLFMSNLIGLDVSLWVVKYKPKFC